jgi:benzoyl-CoA reductase/2-hydroxyglutaryl-CoA dehydratase subunit BcrC/BadD/HgdB
VLYCLSGMGQAAVFKGILDDCDREVGDFKGKPLIGWTCTYLPLEILDAGGLLSCRILPEPFSEQADAYLDPNFCPLIKTSLGTAIQGGYSFLSGIIMVNTCDGMRRLYDAWKFYCPQPFSMLLDVPRTITPTSVAYFRKRLQDLTKRVERHFGVRITEDGLTAAIEEANYTRSLIRRLLSVRGRGEPSLGYGEIVEILAEQWRNSRKVFNEALKDYVEQLEDKESTSTEGLRLMITGSLVEGSSLIRTVEELGGEVVASDLCTGGRFVDEVSLSSDPLKSLSEAYLMKTPCARMYDTGRRIAHIKDRVDRTGAHGVIYYSLKFCDPYLYEAPALQGALRRMGVPLLFIEGEYTGRVSGSVRTRLQAFLEMLERNAA